ncbi:MAG: metallophosphoesterase [Clostridia bacterium]|nr:metallophosphoesterase [Clostridia bacterium]
MMKFLATSDIHGYLPNITEEFDLLMICGDICPATDHSVYYQEKWVKTIFTQWINSLPYKTAWSKVILVPGNYDFWFERMSVAQKLEIEMLCSHRMKILRHDEYEFEYPVSDGLDSLIIFGTPYCSIFGHWAFMVNDETLEKKFSQIENDVDILLSHDSPNIYGLGDVTEGPFKREGSGNPILARHIERIKPLILHTGHFHSGNKNFEERNGTWMANVSYINEDYIPSNAVLSYNFDEETKKVVY